MNYWNKFNTIEEIKAELIEAWGEDDFKDSSDLELVELLAYNEKNFTNGYIVDSERDLTLMFEDMIDTLGITHDDEMALNEHFNNWTDQLCKDGDLHELQYNTYTYVGGR